MSAAAPRVSVVLPVYNERESLGPLWAELRAVLPGLHGEAEVLFVDDGSTDGSDAVIRGLAAADPRVRLLRLDRNHGLSAAFHAGFEAARGEAIVTLDSDLQSDPRDIPALLGRLERFDAACGWRTERRDPWPKRLSSRFANRVRDAVTGDRVHDSACSLRALRRRCLAAIPPLDGMHRFLPTLLRTAGHVVVEVPVHHRPRRYGRSKYGIRNRALRTLVDLLAVRWLLTRQLRYDAVEDP
jgi:dolichol-phosphate mannosyltransferase